MKVTVSEPRLVRPKYPYLGIAGDGEVVLFTAANKGTCLYAVGNSVGFHDDYWVEDKFLPFSGSVTLSN